uniref:Immunoglobulin V-set domain-containing protein n=1 Tax=Naja naja TaxID=35670 RepID=A0A8C6YME7_NAJNA
MPREAPSCLLWPSLEAFSSPLSGFAGVAERQYLNGILGESVTFQLKSNLPFVSVSWIKIVDHNFYKPENISVVTSGEPCSLLVPLPALQDRVKVSEDCRGLQLSPLKQDDRGYYMAEIVLSDEEMVYESFELQVSSKYPSHGSKLLLWLICGCGLVVM